MGTFLWMGGAGVTASTHFDRSHNFFAQVVGRKRFLLWAPWQWGGLYVYPFYHARDRQSQLIRAEWGGQGIDRDGGGGGGGGDDGSATRDGVGVVGNVLGERGERAGTVGQVFPNSVQSNPFGVADIGPGELLYIPPFWWHRVTALTFSVGVNAWSPGQGKNIGDTLNDIGLPKAVSTISRVSPGVASVFLRHIIDGVVALLPLRRSMLGAEQSCTTGGTTTGGGSSDDTGGGSGGQRSCPRGGGEGEDASQREEEDAMYGEDYGEAAELVERLVENRYLPEAAK